MCEFRKGEEAEFRNTVPHDGTVRGEEEEGGDFINVRKREASTFPYFILSI